MQMTCEYRWFCYLEQILIHPCSDDSTQICSCHNVTKGDVVDNVKNGTCTTIAQVKSCTKAGTGCGGCMPLVQSIFNKTMLDMGQEVSNNRKSSQLVPLLPPVITNMFSVLTYPLLSSRSIQRRGHQATEKLYRYHENCRKESRISRLRTMQASNCIHSV